MQGLPTADGAQVAKITAPVPSSMRRARRYASTLAVLLAPALFAGTGTALLASAPSKPADHLDLAQRVELIRAGQAKQRETTAPALMHSVRTSAVHMPLDAMDEVVR